MEKGQLTLQYKGFELLYTWSPAVNSAVCRQAHGTPTPQTQQDSHLLRRSPPEIGKIPVDSDVFGCWTEGTQTLSLPAPALQPALGADTDRQPRAYGNIWREQGRVGVYTFTTFFLPCHFLNAILKHQMCMQKLDNNEFRKILTFSHKSQWTWKEEGNWQEHLEEWRLSLGYKITTTNVTTIDQTTI